MGHQIIQQPDGKYAVFSSVVDDFVIYDATPEEIAEVWTEDERKRIKEKVDRVIRELQEGGKPYYQFTKTWEEACSWAKEVHGKQWKPPIHE